MLIGEKSELLRNQTPLNKPVTRLSGYMVFNKGVVPINPALSACNTFN